MAKENEIRHNWEEIWNKVSGGRIDKHISERVKQNSLKRFFNLIASQIKNAEKKWNFAKWNDELIAPEIKQFAGGENTMVLDAACGSGRITFTLVPATAFSVLTDISDTAIQLCRKNSELHKQGRMKPAIVQSSIVNLPFKQNCFDLVVNIGTIHYFDDNERDVIMSEFHRVLKNGGKLLITVPYQKAYIFRLGMWYAKKTGQWEMVGERTVDSINTLIKQCPGMKLIREFSGGCLIQLYHLIYFFNTNKFLRMTVKKVYLLFAIFTNRVLWDFNFINFWGIYLFGIVEKE
jgi:ubiquinone/menaquinone biosynthesis C-methylase UbiE